MLPRPVALPARLCGVPQDGRDGVDFVELPGGDAHNQVVGLVVGQGQPAAVQAVERDDRGERQPLVAVDEGVVAGNGVQQRRRLGVQVRVGVLAERVARGRARAASSSP